METLVSFTKITCTAIMFVKEKMRKALQASQSDPMLLICCMNLSIQYQLVSISWLFYIWIYCERFIDQLVVYL